MCEYCFKEEYKRNSYKIHGDLDRTIDGEIKVEGESMLEIFFEWPEKIDEKYEQMCFGAGILIRYCPWCGRKLGDE